MTLVRDVRLQDRSEWLRLWNAYVRFYEAEVALKTTDVTFQRILDPDQPLLGRLAERDGQPVGISVSVRHAGTWSQAPSLYLEDLFVDPAARGGGVGHALMADVIELAATEGCAQLYWHTRSSNVAARRLYDRFVAADDFVR